MKRLIFLILSFFIVFSISAQTPEDLERLRKYEDTLAEFSKVMIQSDDFESRYLMAYNMIPRLVEALKTPGSFAFPFDSVKGISIVYPEDQTFRIFSWGLELENGTYRHFGAIQVNNKKKLELYPLIDASIYIENADTVLNSDYWYGANYYNIISKKRKGKKYYYLFGFDGNDRLSTKKIIDVLYFEKNKPVFGAPHFDFSDEEKGIDSVVNRFVIEYNKSAGVSLNFYPEYGRIVYDHVVPKNPLSVGVYSTYIPDGTYEAFEYNKKKGRWIHVDKAWEGGINESDNPPVPHPVDFGKEKEINKKGPKK